MGADLVGTSKADAIYGTGGGALLSGMAGDDTYYVYDISDVVIEAPGQGTDTVILSADGYAIGYALPDHVENIEVRSEGGRAVGNALANIMTGDAGGQWLRSAGGNDILTGGAGGDRFMFEKGDGFDVITDVRIGEDVIVVGATLAGYTNFPAIETSLRQVGQDVVVDFGAGDSVLLRNRLVSDLDERSFSFAPDASGLELAFADEFEDFRVSSNGLVDGEAAWRSTYWWGRAIPTNDEAEFYGDDRTGKSPFDLRIDGILDITASPRDGLPGDLTYTSGVITTQTSHVQTYGHFEIRAQLPGGGGEGFWPASWLLPANGAWPPEIDVFEVLGQETHTDNVSDLR